MMTRRSRKRMQAYEEVSGEAEEEEYDENEEGYEDDEG